MIFKNKIPFRTLLIASLVFLGGCGDSDSSHTSTDPYVAAGVVALAAEDWSEAIEQFEQSSEMESDEVRAYRGSAYAGRAGLSAQDVLEQFTGEDDEGTAVFIPSTGQAMGLVNYYDMDVFNMRLVDGQKGLALLVPSSGSLDDLSDDERIEIALVASGQVLLRIAAILSGQDPADMTDEEIAQAVYASFDANSSGLREAFDLVLELREDLAAELAANFVEAAVTTEVIDAQLESFGLLDGSLTASELIAILQELND